MGRVRVAAFSISLDGYGAGPQQSVAEPLGRGGESLHEWFFTTRTFQQMYGDGRGSDGVDERYAARSLAGLGAWIMGRNMFGPVRGPWLDESWRGWWGEKPPYGVPVFVLTHHPRPPLEMDGGTVFHFVTGGPEAALAQARDAAGDLDIRIGGGSATIRQYLQSGEIDELHLVIAPILLGGGEPLLAGLDLPELGYAVVERTPSEAALHVIIRRSGEEEARA